jgi:archaellum component FlaC
LDAAIRRVEAQLISASRKHLEEIGSLQARHRQAEAVMQQELDKRSAEQTQLESKLRSFEAHERLAKGTEEEESLRSQLAVAQEKLSHEMTARMLLEPRLNQLKRQSARLEEVEAQLATLTDDHAVTKKRETEARARVTELETEVAALTAKVAELRQQNDTMMRRPSMRIYRGANSSSFEAFAQKLDLEKMPSLLRQTRSSILEQAKREAERVTPASPHSPTPPPRTPKVTSTPGSTRSASPSPSPSPSPSLARPPSR